MRVFISGKITGTDDYMERFEKAEKMLLSKGYVVYNPAKVNANMPAETTHGEYMKLSLTILSMTDCIYMMKGWEDSYGANIELQFAVEKHISVLFEE